MSKVKFGHETNLSELIVNISRKPRMYAGSSELRVVAAFINGFAAAKAELYDLRDFSFWLGVKLNLPRNVAWMDNLERKYPISEDALEKLPEFYQEFTSDVENGWSFELEFAREMERIRIKGRKHK